jgi:hypothetical protein
MYGKLDGGEDSYLQNKFSPPDRKIAYLGPSISLDSCIDYQGVTIPPSYSSFGIDGAVLRQPHLFFDLLV